MFESGKIIVALKHVFDNTSLRKFQNFLNDILLNICCTATIILPDSNIGEWNNEYVTSEPNLTDHLVDPQTGIVEVSNIAVIMLK